MFSTTLERERERERKKPPILWTSVELHMRSLSCALWVCVLSGCIKKRENSVVMHRVLSFRFVFLYCSVLCRIEQFCVVYTCLMC